VIKKANHQLPKANIRMTTSTGLEQATTPHGYFDKDWCHTFYSTIHANTTTPQHSVMNAYSDCWLTVTMRVSVVTVVASGSGDSGDDDDVD
jgi:hypothetical protein